MRYPLCAAHQGQHLSIWGQCVHEGAPCALRPGVCPEPGCAAPIVRRLDLSSGRVTTLSEDSDAPHVHPPPVRVELDPEALASAIVAASRVTREERRAERAQPPTERRNGHANEPPPLGGVPLLGGGDDDG